MAEPFDPYYRWLSIPPSEQPPNYYRLLGVAPFEPNEDVLRQAADRQTQYLRQMQGGAHDAESQRLLHEVATARAALLDPTRRDAYDSMLRQELKRRQELPVAHGAAPPAPMQPAATQEEPEPILAVDAGPPFSPSTPPAPMPARRMPPWSLQAIVTGVVLLVLLVGFGLAIGVYSMTTRGNSSSSAALEVKLGQVFAADQHSAYCACISPDDRSIATSGSEFTIRVWNADTGAMKVGNANTNGPVKALAYSTDGELLIAGLLDRLRFSERNAFPIAAFIVFYEGEVTSVATSTDGRYLAATDSSGVVKLWEAKRPTNRLQDQRLSDYREAVGLRGVVFAPDSSHFAIFGENGLLVLRNAPDCDHRATLEGHGRPVTGAAFSPDGDTLYSVDEGGELRRWDARGAVLLDSRSVSESGAQALIITPDGANVLVGGGDGTVSVFDARTLEPQLQIKAHTGTVTSLEFSHRGDWFASSGTDGLVKTWHLRPGGR